MLDSKVLAGLVGFVSMIWMSCSAADVLTVYNDAKDDVYVKLGQPGNVGDQILWHSDIQLADGTKVGTGSGKCARLDDAGNHFCSFVIELDSRGTLAGVGVQRTEPAISRFPIVGGTGEFRNIRGEIRSWPVEERARFLYEIEF